MRRARAAGVTRRIVSLCRVMIERIGRCLLSLVPDLYAAVALLILIGTQARWHRILSESLSDTFITVPGRLHLCATPWLAIGLVLLAAAGFAVVRRVSLRWVTGLARWLAGTIALLPGSILAWAFTGYEFEFLFANLLLVSYLALLASLAKLPDPAPRLREWEKHSAIKQQALLQFEADKYWRGLNILWVATAAGIAALGTYVISGPPSVWSDIVSREQLHALTEVRVWIALALLGAFVPGIIWIVGAIVVRVNRVHRALERIDL